MSKTMEDKFNNLKITSYDENILDKNCPLDTNVKRNRAYGIYKKNLNLLSNHNSNHVSTPSFFDNSNVSNNVDNNVQIVNNNKKAKRSNSKSASFKYNYLSNKYNTTNNNQNKPKVVIDVNGMSNIRLKLTPKSTKATLGNSNNKSVAYNQINSSNKKYTPLSTRGKGSKIFSTNPNSPDDISNFNSNLGINEKGIKTDNQFNSEFINVMSLLSSQNSIPITINNLNTSIPNYDQTKLSIKSMPVIKAYAVNTHLGIIRSYNEDRVSIILNVVKPSTFIGEFWPKSSFFGIYDGHGGVTCADFLRDHLHQFIVKDPNFPRDVKEAIRSGFENAEREFINNYAKNKKGEVIDKSGSCALVIMIVDNMCFTANVGDSRAIMSCDNGREIKQLSTDHKPNEPNEMKRILEYGGKVYQTQTPANNFNLNLNNVHSNQILVGPYRVFPGRLSVSRTFGDVEPKLVKPNVIVSIPEVNSFEITNKMDFIIIGCDGIFDQLNNYEIINSVWLTTTENTKSKNIHSQCGLAVDLIIKTSLIRRTLDNVTCVMIAFSNFEKIFEAENYLTDCLSLKYDEKVNNNNNDCNKNNNQYKNYNLEKIENNSNVTHKKRKELTKENVKNKFGTNVDCFKNWENDIGNIKSNFTKNNTKKKSGSIEIVSNKKVNNKLSKFDQETIPNTKKKFEYNLLIQCKKGRNVTELNHPLSNKNSNLKQKETFGITKIMKRVPSYKGINEKI